MRVCTTVAGSVPLKKAWWLQDTTESVDAPVAVSLIRFCAESNQCETWFESNVGELLVVVPRATRRGLELAVAAPAARRSL